MKIHSKKKKIVIRLLSFFFCYMFIAFIICSCNEKNKNREEYILCIDKSKSKIIDDKLVIKKITVLSNYDSILISRSYNDYKLNSKYFRKGNDYYELRRKGYDANTFIGYDSILSFSIKDTSFFYNSTFRETYFVYLYSLSDAQYRIKKNTKTCSTEKKSMVDSSYIEIFYYNEKFHIYKFVNKYRGNELVYIDKTYFSP